MEAPLAVEIEGLTKDYGSVKALRGVNLQVKRGEIFGFLGPNGAGKTTTIRCLLDLIRPRSGRMRVLGINPAKDPVAVRSHTGYLPGELNLEGNLTVEQVLRYFSELRGRRSDLQYVRRLAGRLELDLAVAVKNLSKGNKQKVGLVQALMHRPELLLLDEPTSGLDPLMQQEVYHLLREAQEERRHRFLLVACDQRSRGDRWTRCDHPPGCDHRGGRARPARRYVAAPLPGSLRRAR
jgi:ABC-2 type transport system ATP-binding protein